MVAPSSMATRMLTTAALAVSLTLAPAQPAGAVPAEAPPSEKVVVDLVTVSGSGCPKGTTYVTVSPDNTSISLGFSDFIAGVGLGMKATDFRKNCSVSLAIQAPSGFTYAIRTAKYTGYAILEPGASGLVRTNFYFAGMPETRSAQYPLTGPFEESWTFENTTDLPGLIWTPCGEPRYYTFSFELRVRAGTSDVTTKSSIIAFDSPFDAIDPGATYQLEWKRCPTA